MTTTLVKEPAFIQPPVNKPGDTTSGMQPAASGGVIGNRAAVDGTLLPGQDIGHAGAPGYLRVTSG
jgi:hypothetical protein